MGPRSYLSRTQVLVEGGQTLFDGVNGRLGAVGQVQFAEDAADVVLDGFLADVKGDGNLLVAHSLGNALENFPFPGSKIFFRGCGIIRGGWPLEG